MNAKHADLCSATSAEADTRIAAPPGALSNAVPAAGMHVPLEVLDQYPMIRGSVNGQAGRFMLDLGTRMGVLLNSNRLQLGPSTEIGQGFAGSGQPVVLHLHDNVEQLEIWTGAMLENVGWAHSGNFGFIEEGIADDFLGFIGTGILSSFEFTLDYAHGSIFFSRLAVDGTPLSSSYDNKDVVATLSFSTNAAAPYEPILPMVDFTLGGFTIPLSFDTGNPGGKMVLPKEIGSALFAAGLLVPEESRFRVIDLSCGDSKLSFSGVDVEVGEAQHGTIGYSFFRHYKTSWNYQTGTLKLFAPVA